MKRPRYISDWLLTGVIAMGAVYLVRLSLEQATLKEEHDRLAQISGELNITDPGKVHFRALKTDDPLHFAWRVYIPRNYSLVLKEQSGGFSSSTLAEPAEFVARVRLREGDRGVLQVYSSFYGGSGLMSLGDKALAELIRGREQELKVEQLGSPAPVAIPATKAETVISIRLSEKMIAEAQGKVNPGVLERHNPILYELRLQPPGSGP